MHVAGGRVDVQLAEAQAAVARFDPAMAAQVGTQAGEQHPRFDGFTDVIVGPQLQSQHLVDVVGAGGQHTDDAVIVGPDLPTHFETILVGQADIEQDQGRLLGQDPGHRALATALMGHLVAMPLQIVADHRTQAGIVFNQYDIQHFQGLRGRKRTATARARRCYPSLRAARVPGAGAIQPGLLALGPGLRPGNNLASSIACCRYKTLPS